MICTINFSSNFLMTDPKGKFSIGAHQLSSIKKSPKAHIKINLNFYDDMSFL
jgi:hypothetical protein